jgi:hypothetical protein
LAPAESEERRRPEERDPGKAERLTQLLERTERSGELGPRDDDRDEMPERRVPELLPPCELVGEEARDVVSRREPERRRVGLERLHEDDAGRVPPAPSRELRDELEGSLLRPEVGKGEPRVGIDHCGHGHAREVMPFRNHLRPDEHSGARAPEALEGVRELPGSRRGVRVESDALEPGNAFLELRLEALGAGADPRQLDRAALGAAVRKLLREAAVMTVQTAVRVEGEGHVAARTAA